VRFALSLLILILASSSLMAQDQERKLIDRILKPNMEQKFNPEIHSTNGVKTFTAGAAPSKGFYSDKQVSDRGKDYNSKDFAGSKGAWMGDTKFTTKAAKTDSGREIKNAVTKAPTKAAQVKDDPDRNKAAPTREVYYAKREYAGPESKKIHSTVTADKENSWKGNLQPMSIDDVRDLLNKIH